MAPTSKFIKEKKKTELNDLAQLTSLPKYARLFLLSCNASSFGRKRYRINANNVLLIVTQV